MATYISALNRLDRHCFDGDFTQLCIEKESRTNRSSACQDVSNHDLVNLFYTLAMLQVIFAGDIY